MTTEIEAKFLEINHDTIRLRLLSAGAVMAIPMRMMSRTLFDFPDGRLQMDNEGRIRIRDEGGKVTLSFKSSAASKYDKELETTVGSFSAACQIMEAIGLEACSSQESKRETWQSKGVEVVLDVWPWLNPYIEIEGETEAAIKNCARVLGLDWKDAKFGNVDVAYRHQYAHFNDADTIGKIKKLTFEGAIPSFLVQRQ